MYASYDTLEKTVNWSFAEKSSVKRKGLHFRQQIKLFLTKTHAAVVQWYVHAHVRRLASWHFELHTYGLPSNNAASRAEKIWRLCLEGIPHASRYSACSLKLLIFKDLAVTIKLMLGSWFVLAVAKFY